jgi:hypothetical protein
MAAVVDEQHPQIIVDFLLGPDFWSRSIAWYGEGYDGYSHCAGLLADGRYLDSRADVIAGVPAGVQIRLPKTERWVKRRRATLQVPQQIYDGWEMALRAKIGTPYAKSDILGFILGRPLHEAGHWDCSATQVNAVQRVKIVPYPLPVPAHQVTPNTLLLILATAGFTIGPVESGRAIAAAKASGK